MDGTLNGKHGHLWFDGHLVGSFDSGMKFELHLRARWKSAGRRNMIPLFDDNEFEDALHKMQQHGFQGDVSFYASLLRYCSKIRHLSAGKTIHSHIRNSGHCLDRYLCNLLVEMYGKCGSLDDARRTFDTICDPNVFSRTLMFAAYAQNGHLQDARVMFDQMPRRDVAAWNAMITAYVQSGHLQEARDIFDRMTQRDVVSWTSMVTAYAQCRDLRKARSMFDRMPQRNMITWNAMLAAYVQNGELLETKRMFDRMPERDAVSWNIMVAAYAQNGDLQKARDLFEKSPERNCVSWNTMITSYVQKNNLGVAKEMFDKMKQRDCVSWNAMMTGYAQNGLLEEARCLFDRMPQKGAASWNAMIAGYAQNGHLEEARIMFDSMPERDLVSWNAMIAGYAQNGQGKEAIKLFDRMRVEGVQPDKVTCVSALDACASTSASAEGRSMHVNVVNCGFQSDVTVGNALINMYGKCGYLEKARSILDAMPQLDVVSWNTMICSYAQNGHAEIAVELLEKMDLEGTQPNEITFFGILAACSHGGLSSKAREYFIAMLRDYEVQPMTGHYACMIDLLGRTGLLNEAEDLLSFMPVQPDAISWMALISASRLHGDAKLGARAAHQVDPGNSAAYVLLSNMYTCAD